MQHIKRNLCLYFYLICFIITLPLAAEEKISFLFPAVAFLQVLLELAFRIHNIKFIFTLLIGIYFVASVVSLIGVAITPVKFFFHSIETLPYMAAVEAFAIFLTFISQIVSLSKMDLFSVQIPKILIIPISFLIGSFTYQNRTAFLICFGIALFIVLCIFSTIHSDSSDSERTYRKKSDNEFVPIEDRRCFDCIYYNGDWASPYDDVCAFHKERMGEEGNFWIYWHADHHNDCPGYRKKK